MAIFSLFKSKSTRELEAKIRFRRGKSRVQAYIQEALRSAERYWQLAREAYRLGDADQFRMIGTQYLRLQDTISRWQRFVVKLEALELRRNEVSATKDFMLSINELTAAMNHGVTPQELARMQVDIQRAIEKSKAQESMLDVAMEFAGTAMDGDIAGDGQVFEELEQSIASSLRVEPGRFRNQSDVKYPANSNELESDVVHAIERLSREARS